MDIQDWKDSLVEKAVRQITFKSNMSSKDITNLTTILFYYLDEGISVLKEWRKIKNDSEFVSKRYDSALVQYLINKNLVNGREMFDVYTSGGVKADMKKSPESVLKSNFCQVI